MKNNFFNTAHIKEEAGNEVACIPIMLICEFLGILFLKIKFTIKV